MSLVPSSWRCCNQHHSSSSLAQDIPNTILFITEPTACLNGSKGSKILLLSWIISCDATYYNLQTKCYVFISALAGTSLNSFTISSIYRVMEEPLELFFPTPTSFNASMATFLWFFHRAPSAHIMPAWNHGLKHRFWSFHSFLLFAFLN